MLSDESYIRLTLEIAKRGAGHVSPNPMVGCVVIKNNRIIGAGYHEVYGGKHAEVNAIESARESVEGAELFVNLEPCSHHGKTPPCVDFIIEKKIKRVVVGTLDMNPLVSGQGIRKLKKAGIEVKVGLLENECIELNKFFFKFISKNVPYVTLKAAQTIDGKIADVNGYSKWISCPASRQYVHNLRSKYDAVLVGAGTIEYDDPQLTVRLTDGRNPHRVIIDSALKLSLDHSIFHNNMEGNLYLFTSIKNAKKKKIKQLEDLKVKVVLIRADSEGHLNLNSVLKELGKEGISSILVEGGSKIYSSFISKNIFDNILIFVTPKILGPGLSLASQLKERNIKNAYKLKIGNFEKIGDDVLIDFYK